MLYFIYPNIYKILSCQEIINIQITDEIFYIPFYVLNF